MDTEGKDKSVNNDEEDYPFHHFVRKLMLAGIGALSYSREEWEKFIEKMVERGEATHKDHEAQLNDLHERRRQFMHDRKGYAQKRVAKALDEFNVPTKGDIDEVKTKISALEKKIDELKNAPDQS